jgi:hypothetical protein
VKIIPSIPKNSDELPFEPFTETLKSIIRKKYIARVYEWLLGKHVGSILAEESNSNWESALSIRAGTPKIRHRVYSAVS